VLVLTEEDMRRMVHVHVDFCGVFDSYWLAEHVLYAITCNAYAPGRVRRGDVGRE